ncbi:MAG: energy transducer TonB, partial [Desulfurivibrionaceae bacterium]
NWILPEVTDWQKDLEAVLSITISREGRVIRSEFERRSSNIYFDRFVEKTLEKSSPLPPFPDTLEKEQIEIGLIFHPEGLK